MNIIEILSWVFDEEPGVLNYYLNFTFNFLVTAINTVIAVLWLYYIDFMLFRDYNRLKRKKAYMLPAVIMLILSIINVFEPILFVISENNVYQRLPLLWISIPLIFGMYIYALVMVLKYATTHQKKILVGVLVFFIIPIIAAILQLIFYGLMLIWPSTALAILISYLIFETTSNARDYLTNLFTRERAEEYIAHLIQQNRHFSIVMMDINNFKMINDRYGHHVGDQVLIDIASILQDHFIEKSLVARYGGDEYLVVTEITDKVILNQIRENLVKTLKDIPSKVKEEITLSFGFATCYTPKSCTIGEIIIEADNQMYRDKAFKKNTDEMKQ
jgi:diguanylate cyclase (GGDEF)-like protein